MTPQEKEAHDVLVKDLQDTIKGLLEYKDESIIVYNDLSKDCTDFRNEVTTLKNRLKDRDNEYEYQLEEKNRLLRNGVDEIANLKSTILEIIDWEKQEHFTIQDRNLAFKEIIDKSGITIYEK